jgi:outer membrane immunogenic protein
MKRLLITLGAVASFITPVAAADIAARTYTKAPAMVVDPAYNWTGFYVGANAGGAWGTFDPTTTVSQPVGGYFITTDQGQIAAAGVQRIKASGFTGGFEAGYNVQSGNWVFGLEGDIESFHLSGKATSGPIVYLSAPPSTFTVNSSVSSDWLATVRGRVGFLATPALLLYGTGGLAVANVKAAYLFADNFGPASESAAISTTRYGWTAGAGGEYALMNGWSIKAEYLYADLGRASTTSTNLIAAGILFPTNVFTHTVNLRANIGRVGINYKFGGPVVAKY